MKPVVQNLEVVSIHVGRVFEVFERPAKDVDMVRHDDPLDVVAIDHDGVLGTRCRAYENREGQTKSQRLGYTYGGLKVLWRQPLSSRPRILCDCYGRRPSDHQS